MLNNSDTIKYYQGLTVEQLQPSQNKHFNQNALSQIIDSNDLDDATKCELLKGLLESDDPAIQTAARQLLDHQDDSTGRYPIHYAASNSLACTQYLLTLYPALYHQRDRNGLVALHCTATRPDTLAYLCGPHFDGDHKYYIDNVLLNGTRAFPEGITLLEEAIEKSSDIENLPAIEALLKNGARIFRRNYLGNGYLIKETEIMALLRQYDVDPHLKPSTEPRLTYQRPSFSKVTGLESLAKESVDKKIEYYRNLTTEQLEPPASTQAYFNPNKLSEIIDSNLEEGTKVELLRHLLESSDPELKAAAENLLEYQDPLYRMAPIHRAARKSLVCVQYLLEQYPHLYEQKSMSGRIAEQCATQPDIKAYLCDPKFKSEALTESVPGPEISTALILPFTAAASDSDSSPKESLVAGHAKPADDSKTIARASLGSTDSTLPFNATTSVSGSGTSPTGSVQTDNSKRT